jgi:hypothetical protein
MNLSKPLELRDGDCFLFETLNSEVLYYMIEKSKIVYIDEKMDDFELAENITERSLLFNPKFKYIGNSAAEPEYLVFKYIPKRISIEAIKLSMDNIDYIMKWSKMTVNICNNEKRFFINTLEGKMEAKLGDYIIKGTKGECYPCKPDIFEFKYEIYLE